jgi:ammonia channel protein AmtB
MSHATYAPAADFYFQVVFVATAMSIVSGAVAERMKLWAFLAFAVVMTGFIYPMEGSWTWGGNPVFGMYTLGDLGFLDFAGSGIVHMAGAAAALAGVLLLGPARRQVPRRRLRQGHSRCQPAAGHPRHLHSVAGLVRLQRRLRAGHGQRRERQRVAVVFMNTNGPLPAAWSVRCSRRACCLARLT